MDWTTGVALASATIATVAAGVSAWQAIVARRAAVQAGRQADAALRELPPSISLVPSPMVAERGADLVLVVLNHNRHDLHLVEIEFELPDALTVALDRGTRTRIRPILDRMRGSPSAPIKVDLRDYFVVGSSLGGGETPRIELPVTVFCLEDRAYSDPTVEVKATVVFEQIDGVPIRMTRTLPTISVPFMS